MELFRSFLFLGGGGGGGGGEGGNRGLLISEEVVKIWQNIKKLSNSKIDSHRHGVVIMKLNSGGLFYYSHPYFLQLS